MRITFCAWQKWNGSTDLNEHSVFVLSKVFWTLVQPLSLLLVLIGIAVFALHRGRLGLAKHVLIGVLCAFLLIGFFPVGNLILKPLETRFSIQTNPPSPKTIIVLGGSEDVKPSSQSLLPALSDAGERPIYGIALATLVFRRDTCFHRWLGVCP